MDNTIWGNENPGPPAGYDEHEEDCKCFNCEIKRKERDDANIEFWADHKEDR